MNGPMTVTRVALILASHLSEEDYQAAIDQMKAEAIPEILVQGFTEHLADRKKDGDFA